MSDTLSNALHGGSLLERIANPTVVNPLAAYQGAAQTANSIWTNRKMQAEQAAGEAFQNSIGPDGTPNQTALLQNLKNNPAAALAAQQSAQLGQNLDQTTYETHMKRLGAGAAGFTQILAQNHGDAPLDAIKTYLANGVRDGHITQAEADQLVQQFGPDAAQNGNIGRQMVARNMEVQTALKAARPSVQLQDVGGHMVPLTTQGELSPQPGQMTLGGGPMITRTQTPDELAHETPIYTKNADGTYSQVPSPRSDRPGAITTPTITTLGGGQGAPPPTPPRPGSGPIPGAYPGRAPSGAGGAPAPAAPAPAGAPAAPTPAAPTPAAPTPAAPAPAAPLLSPPQGQPERLAAGNKLYTEANAAIPDQQKRLIAGESALEAMKLAATGPSTGYVAQAKAWLEARGETPDGTDGLSPAAARQVLQKQLLRFAQDSAKRSGTDLGLETQLHSNANADVMLSSANRHVLLQDIGMQRRDMAMNKMMPQGEAALDHVKNFPTDTDPRAFAFDVMTKEERNAVRADAARTKGGTEKLNHSLEIAHQLGLIKLPSAGQ